MNKFPFRAMFHDGNFTNLEYQPSRDFVGCNCNVGFAQLRTAYKEKLLAEGMIAEDAEQKSSKTIGAIVILTDQFAVMGIDRGVIFTDGDQNKAAWKLIVKVGTMIGQPIGVEPAPVRVKKLHFAEPDHTSEKMSELSRQYRETISVVDRVDTWKKNKKQSKQVQHTPEPDDSALDEFDDLDD